MKFLAFVHENFEDSFVKELIELLKIQDCQVKDSCVIFEINENIKENLSHLILYSRSIKKLIALHESFEFEEQEDIVKKINLYYEQNDINKLLNSFFKSIESKFKVTNFRSKTIKFNEAIDIVSQDLDAETGSIVLEKTKLKVKLENPDLIITNLIIGNICYHGIDLLGIDVTKRDYKIFTLPNSLKSTLIFSILYKYMDEDTLKNIKKKTIVNYSINDGSFLIELAQKIKNVSYLTQEYRNLIINKYYDISEFFESEEDIRTLIVGLDSNFNSLNVVKKNLALSGVKDIIKISRLDMTWLDTKYDAKTVDYFFSFFIPNSTLKPKELVKYVDDMMYQLEFVLKGKAVILTTKQEIFNEVINKKEMKIKITDKLNFNVGTNSYTVIVIKQK